VTRERRGQRRWLAAATTIVTLLLSLVGSATAADEPDEASEPEEAAPSRERQSTPAVAPTVAAPVAAAPTPPFIEHMGPDTYPGRLRGIYGGSLWLEPDFQGMQWPHNTQSGLGISANFWIDSGREAINRGTDQLPNTTVSFQQGRSVLRLTPAYVSGNLFVQAQMELVGNLCQATTAICLSSGTFATDDLWIRFGAWNAWDVKVGRFEAWEVYHTGMGLEPYTLERLGAGMFGIDTFTTPRLEAPTFYGVTYLHDRPSEGLELGNVAVHLYPTDYLRFEVLGRVGSDNYRADNATGDTAWNYFGGRPTIIFDVGWFKLRLGGEYQKRTATTQGITPGMPAHKTDPVPTRLQKGVGGSIQFVINPIVEFGVNAAIAHQDDTNAFAAQVPENTTTTTSVGGFANVRFTDRWVAGGGVNWTSQTDAVLAAGSTANDFTAQLQSFLAVQYRPMGYLYVKAVVAPYTRADFLPSDLAVPEWHNHMVSGRIRLLYIY
jgi:hypothetical protein